MKDVANERSTSSHTRPGSGHPDGDVPNTWADGEAETQRFVGLLRKYDDDWQKANDAMLRGEEPDPDDMRGSPNPM